MDFIWNPWDMSQKPKESFMDRNHGAYVIYHFCFSLNNLFPVKLLCHIARNRIINTIKNRQVFEALVSPTCSHLQWRWPCLSSLRPVWGTQICRLYHPGSLFLLAVLKELGQNLHKFTQDCRALFLLFFFLISFFCVLPLTCCIALGKLLNLAKTLLFPL